MGRLIDADKLMLHLNDYALQVAPFRDNDLEGLAEYKTVQECMKAIEEQPTAYRPKTVMAEIEDYSRKCYGDISVIKIMSIVRKGGVE